MDWQPSYDRDEEYILREAKRLLTKRPLGDSKLYTVYLLQGSDPFSDLPRQLERAVLEKEFHMGSAIMAEQYDKFEANSQFILVLEASHDPQDVTPVGMMRLICGQLNELKSSIDVRDNVGGWGENEYSLLAGGVRDCEQVVDVATMCTNQRIRDRIGSKAVTVVLFHALYHWSRHNSVAHWIGILADGVLKGLQWYGMEFAYIGESKSYLGTPNNSPFRGNVAQIASSLRQKGRQPNAGLILDGAWGGVTLADHCNLDPELTCL